MQQLAIRETLVLRQTGKRFIDPVLFVPVACIWIPMYVVLQFMGRNNGQDG